MVQADSLVTKEDVVYDFRMRTIREAAARVVASEGIAGATVEGIANEAGIAKGTIYLYFGSRDELLSSATELVFEWLLERLEESFDLDPSDVRSWLEGLVRNLLEFCEEHKDFLRIYYEVLNDEIDHAEARSRRRRHPKYQHYLDRLANCLDLAMEHGSIRKANSKRLAFLINEAITAITVVRLVDEVDVPIEEDLQLVVSTLMDGIGADA